MQRARERERKRERVPVSLNRSPSLCTRKTKPPRPHPELTVFDFAPPIDLTLDFDVSGFRRLVDRKVPFDERERNQVGFRCEDRSLERCAGPSSLRQHPCFQRRGVPTREKKHAPASLKWSKSDTTDPSFKTVASGCRVLRILSYNSILTLYVFSTQSIKGFQCASCNATRRSGNDSWKLHGGKGLESQPSGVGCLASVRDESECAHQTVSVSRYRSKYATTSFRMSGFCKPSSAREVIEVCAPVFPSLASVSASNSRYDHDWFLTMGKVWGFKTAVWFSHSSAMQSATGNRPFGTVNGAPPGVLSVRLSSRTA